MITGINDACITAQIVMIEAMAESLCISMPKHILAKKAWYPSSYNKENTSRVQAYDTISSIGYELAELKKKINDKNPIKILESIFK